MHCSLSLGSLLELTGTFPTAWSLFRELSLFLLGLNFLHELKDFMKVLLQTALPQYTAQWQLYALSTLSKTATTSAATKANDPRSFISGVFQVFVLENLYLYDKMIT